MDISIDDEAYEILMAAYQVTQIASLDAVLKRNGIADAASRRRICAEFADASGSLLDRGWLQADGAAERVWPELLFSTRTLDPEEGLGPMQSLLVPEYASSFHEYVDGSVEFYFTEHGESVGGIRYGYL